MQNEETKETARIVARFAKYLRDPVLYAKEVLGIDILEDWQKKALRDIAKYDRVAIAGANGVGKGLVLAIAILWYFDTHPNCKIPVTSASMRQAKFSLWSEVCRLAGQSKLRESYNINQDNLTRKGHENVWQVVAFSADEPERAEGWHNPFLLYCIDEARGVPDEIFKASFRAATQPSNKIIVASIPGQSSGMFFEIFNRLKKSWRLHTIPAARFKWGRYCAEFPHLVSQASISEKLMIEGESSPWFRSSVLAEFYQSTEDSLVPVSMILKARDNVLDPGQSAPIYSLDPARFGRDQSAICIRQGPCVMGFKQRQGLDTVSCSTWIELEAGTHTVIIDSCGIGGAIQDNLKARGRGGTYGVNVAEKPKDGERFVNLRAELYWQLRERFEKNQVDLSRLDADTFDKLKAQLCTIRFEFKSGKVQIEAKESLKKRGLPSPDMADALMLSYSRESTCTWTGPLVIGESIAGSMLGRSWESSPEPEPDRSGAIWSSGDEPIGGCPPGGW